MPLSISELRLLNDRIDNVGDSFRTRRLDRQNATNEDSDRAMRQRMFDEQMKRDTQSNDIANRQVKVAETQANRKDDGTVQYYFVGTDGGEGSYQGTPSGWEEMKKSAEAAGQPIKPIQKPKSASPRYGTFKYNLPTGTVEAFAYSPEDLDIIAKHAKDIGGTAPPNAANKEPFAYDTVTDTTDYGPTEGSPAVEPELSGHFWNGDRKVIPGTGHPAVAPIVAHKSTTTHRVPHNKAMPFPAGEQAGTPVGGVNVDNELKMAVDALKQGADYDKVAAKYKARTGQELPAP